MALRRVVGRSASRGGARPPSISIASPAPGRRCGGPPQLSSSSSPRYGDSDWERTDAKNRRTSFDEDHALLGSDEWESPPSIPGIMIGGGDDTVTPPSPRSNSPSPPPPVTVMQLACSPRMRRYSKGLQGSRARLPSLSFPLASRLSLSRASLAGSLLPKSLNFGGGGGIGGGNGDFQPPPSFAIHRKRPSVRSLGGWSEVSRSSWKLDADERVRVEYYVNENTFKERLQLYFVKNQRSSLRIRICNLVFKLLSCLLYILRVVLDHDPIHATCYDCVAGNRSEFLDSEKLTEEQFSETPIINWDAIIWVQRPIHLWMLQGILAVISLVQALVLAYLGYKGNIWQQVLSAYFVLDMVNAVPFVVTLFWPPLRNLFIPVFLNCWLAKVALENMFNDLHRAMQRSQSALSQQLTILSATLVCLVFTSVCGLQHFQRAGHRHMDLFQSTYFVVVTFSTVGYGDFVPDIWPSQLFMVIMIGVALIVLPTQFEQLAFTWMERQKLGGSYSSHRAHSERHVVVCSTNLHADTIMDFLNEFYAHPLLQDFYVVLLSPMELDTTMRMILQVPIWAQRVIYIQGSCLKDADLVRARMNDAEACFILAARNYADKTAADEHTILRSWAVKDFAPSVPQYVQIFRPENKLHVKFAEHVVCEDEFKYALLANNCLCPGTSTLVTLLLHTSRGQEGQTSNEEWQRLYGKCSGNEIYHIRLADSRFFGEYEGKSFTYASFHSHRKYGVALVGVRPSELPEFYEDTLLLNPGPRHVMKKTDICFYMSISKEENSAFVATQPTAITQPDGTTVATTDPGGGGTGGGGGGTVGAGTATETQATTSKAVPAKTLASAEEGNGSESDAGDASHIKLDMLNITSGEETCTVGDGNGEGSGASLLTTTTAPLMGNNISVTTIITDSPPADEATDNLIPSGSQHHLSVPSSDDNPNLLSPSSLGRRRDSRRPSILPVPDMFSSSMDIPGMSAAPAPAPIYASPYGFNSSRNNYYPYEDTSPSGGGDSRYSGNEDGEDDEADDDVPWRAPSEKIAIVKGFPPVSPYIGVSPTLCYLLKEKKPLCCLQLAQVCEHCSYRSAKEYEWENRAVILAADFASTGIYNFLIPLRAHFRPRSSLNPIILLLERRPDIAFLDAMACFPLVYWMLGSIDCLDDLLRAGISLAANVVVANKELSNSAEEDSLADCNTIVAVQMMFRFFPSIKIITELSQSSNMRFMQFRAHDKYALHLSKMEKREKERGSHISYMFRLPFAAGHVFSASMLDTLLYQAFVKDYLVTFVRLLLGVDQAPGSGFLTSMRVTAEDMWIRTYGRLYQKLCSTTCEIPIGIYRTQDTTGVELNDDSDGEGCSGAHGGNGETSGMPYHNRRRSTSSASHTQPWNIGCYGKQSHRSYQVPGTTTSSSGSLSDEDVGTVVGHHNGSSHAEMIERAEIANLVRSRMAALSLNPNDYDDVSEKRNSLSYVITNPSCDLKLQEGDIIFLIRPSPFSAQKTFERHHSRRCSRISNAASAPQPAPCLSGSNDGGNGGLSRLHRTGSSGSDGALAPSSNILPTSFRRPPSLTAKGTSLSLPESSGSDVGGVSVTVEDYGYGGGVRRSNFGIIGPSGLHQRARSNSLRVVDDILLRRSNSLRQGLASPPTSFPTATPFRRLSSYETYGLPSFAPAPPPPPPMPIPPPPPMPVLQVNPPPPQIKIALNGSIGLEVTPPDEDTETDAAASENNNSNRHSNHNSNGDGASGSFCLNSLEGTIV